MRAAAILAAALFAAAARADVYDCVIDPSETVDVAAASGGVVAHIHAEPGDQVKRGQLLAELDSTVQRATVEMLRLRADDMSEIEAQKAQLTFLEARLKRTQELSSRGVASREVLEEAQTAVDSARSMLVRVELARRVAMAELKRAEAVLSLLEIRSPIDGIVLERYFDDGEYLPLEGRIATIVQLDPLEVVAFLPVQKYGSVHEGDVAQVRPAAPVDGVYPAETLRVDRVFDVASGTFGLHLKLDNPDLKIPAGHRCKVSFDEVPETGSSN
ncbi:efflux RND transporter periplasmic adaptor subunit [Pseudodonghicola flavimaris]|uniref:Efflux RND transporter periplasmic adaptor subunit n=1 Tax=Pseudodonghicola flavimaris TaxID=3050036 RepID=A0ABT7F0A7_9RHOB|nr:efflux RND transporter periplasmic adaptor subunit [Pseudodonghicola flavimaris]MDK3018046.1 efflux RND transporter periplasmic adaptor subunit [Pseudodonghicola flavimaris]